MPIALIAKFTFDPERILKSRWTHDIVHSFVAARQAALARVERLAYRGVPQGV